MIEKFEDLEIWKRSRVIAIEIYRLMKRCREYAFKDQITRAALSIPSNIAEGFESGSDREFVRFLNIARGSCGELRTQISIFMEIGIIEKQSGDELYKETQEISAMITSLINKREKFINRK